MSGTNDLCSKCLGEMTGVLQIRPSGKVPYHVVDKILGTAKVSQRNSIWKTPQQVSNRPWKVVNGRSDYCLRVVGSFSGPMFFFQKV